MKDLIEKKTVSNCQPRFQFEDKVSHFILFHVGNC